MFDLAAHYGERPVLLREIAEREDISEKYLWHLINPLKGVGLVKATRGVHGGYVLGKPPAEISMKDVLQVLEGPLCLLDCVEDPSACKRSSFCVAHDIWGEVAKTFSEKLESTTLADMVERKKSKQSRSDDYMI
jgi:Rrf2 family protein